jgi:DNA-binding response OmpR family regulator
VLDISLPGLNGLDLQKQVAVERPDMPIIFITGYGDVPKTVQAMKAGAVEFLTKPFSEDVLLRAIRQAVERSETTLGHAAEMLRQRRRRQHCARGVSDGTGAVIPLANFAVTGPKFLLGSWWKRTDNGSHFSSTGQSGISLMCCDAQLGIDSHEEST